eukprot:Skav223235  [mRNA]  locus=scaffold2231:312396:317175:- [translate_table: standard]
MADQPRAHQPRPAPAGDAKARQGLGDARMFLPQGFSQRKFQNLLRANGGPVGCIQKSGTEVLVHMAEYEACRFDKGDQEITARASEALARIIAAEVKPESEGGGPPPEQPVQIAGPGALCGLFLAACGAEAASKEIVPQLLVQLSSNEVIEAKQAAEAHANPWQSMKP